MRPPDVPWCNEPTRYDEPCRSIRCTRTGAILELPTRHGARNVRAFGSVARGEDRPDSDVDLLVDVEPGRSLLDVIALEQDLETRDTAYDVPLTRHDIDIGLANYVRSPASRSVSRRFCGSAANSGYRESSDLRFDVVLLEGGVR